MPKIYESVKEDVWTDLNVKQIAALCYFAAKLGTDNIDRRMVPGNYLNMDGVSYWGIDQKKKNAMVNEIFGLNITEFVQEDDVTYLREQVHANLVEKIQLGQHWIQAAGEMTAKYDSVLLAAEKAQLNNGIAAVNNAISKGTKPKEIAAAAQALEAVHNTLAAGLAQRKAEVAAAEAALSAIGTELPSFHDRIQPEDSNQLNAKMSALREKIAQKKFSEIRSATGDLSSYWSSLKTKLQQPEETAPPQEETPTDNPPQEQPPQDTAPQP
jgi:hypothetical protein